MPNFKYILIKNNVKQQVLFFKSLQKTNYMSIQPKVQIL